MAWTAPRTWASGEIPTAAQLNTDLRDNLNELSRHAHGGGSGSGTAALGNLVSMTFIDAAAPAAPGGTLTRVYSSSTALFWRNAGGIYSASTAGHEHAITDTGTIRTMGTTTGGVTGTGVPIYSSIASGGFTATIISTSYTVGGTGSRGVLVSGVASVHMINVPSTGVGTFTAILHRSGTVLAEQAVSGGAQRVHVITVSTLEKNVAAGGYTYALVIVGDTTATGNILGQSLILTEVRQA